MIAYRVVAADRAADALSGTGAFLYGGRWSSPGTRLVYASTHLSLAALEILVHATTRRFRESRVAVRLELPDDGLRRLDADALPADWDALPAAAAAQRLGDQWAAGGLSLGLLVPTAILPRGPELEESNLLLNPAFPGFAERVRPLEVFPFQLDRRLSHPPRADA